MAGDPLNIPWFARKLLEAVPDAFRDDGCSKSPDWNFSWACRIHDWWYCTRAHPEGQMTSKWRETGDHVVKTLIHMAMPSWLRWVGGLYFTALRIFGGHSFNSCGPDPWKASDEQREKGLCRHDLPQPSWMKP